MKTGIGGILGVAAGCVLLLSGCAATTAVAEEPVAAAVIDRAARLSYLEGDVDVALEGGGDWAEPRLNLTLSGGDRLRTGRDARAELRWNRGALRLDGGSEVELDRLTDRRVRVPEQFLVELRLQPFFLALQAIQLPKVIHLRIVLPYNLCFHPIFVSLRCHFEGIF
jgi:hypothetical protein